MKVILLAPTADLVGSSVHIYNLAKLLHKNNLLDVVVCPASRWLDGQLSDSGIPCAVVPMSFRASAWFSSSRTLLSFLRSRAAADIVHVHGRFPLMVSAWARRKLSHLTFVATAHQFPDASLGGIGGWKWAMERRQLKQMRRICCVSEGLREKIVEWMGDPGKTSSIECIPNWIEPLWSAQAGSRPPAVAAKAAGSVPTICAAGNFLPHKGFDILLRALAALRQMGVALDCDIFGDGSLKPELLQLAAELEIADHVSFRQPTADFRRLLPQYDVVVIPSRSESFSIVALEANDAGVAVIASNAPGLRETVLDNETGLLFENGDWSSLALNLERLLASPRLAAQLVERARQRLRNYVSGPEFLSAYVRFYEAALEKPQPVGSSPAAQQVLQ